MKGKKFDNGKPRLAIIFKYLHIGFLYEFAQVMEFGAKKYGFENWKNDLNTDRIENALVRHLEAYLKGDKIDKESGFSHLIHIVCNAMFLWFYDNVKKLSKQ